MERVFLRNKYLGSDGDDFRNEFIEFLEQALANNRWDAMSDYVLYLQGGKKAIEEIIAEIKDA